MEYKVLPKLKPRSAEVSKRLKKEKEAKEEQARLASEKKKKALVAKKAKEEARKKKMESEIASAIKENTSGIEGALSELKAQIAKIELEVPELLEGDKISEAIISNTDGLESSINKLNESISKIKLDVQVQEVDLTSHTKSLNAANKRNNDGLKAVLENLQKQIETIRFEAPEPITEWRFHVIRDRSGYMKDIEAKAVNQTKTLN